MRPSGNKVDIREAARRLGTELWDAPHVIGVSLLKGEGGGELQLVVDLDSESVATSVPQTFLGYPVSIRIVGKPRFA